MAGSGFLALRSAVADQLDEYLRPIAFKPSSGTLAPFPDVENSSGSVYSTAPLCGGS